MLGKAWLDCNYGIAQGLQASEASKYPEFRLMTSEVFNWCKAD
jgi:hypothetical protein